MPSVFLRRADPHERDAVRSLVQTVVDEVYGGLWAAPPLPVDEENWALSWVALVDDKIAGVVLTGGPWVSDLWVLCASRGCGIGRQLLATAEAEIRERGHSEFRLRVVKANVRAVEFYRRHGWRVSREFPHEQLPVTMLEMVKSVPQD
jgi:ribosomal protein S18 acetylase RimI-like enzyme